MLYVIENYRVLILGKLMKDKHWKNGETPLLYASAIQIQKIYRAHLRVERIYTHVLYERRQFFYGRVAFATCKKVGLEWMNFVILFLEQFLSLNLKMPQTRSRKIN